MTASEEFRKLHIPGSPLVLPNAWDAASARMVEAAGFPAIATSSSAMAAVLGYDDGEATPVAEILADATRIARSVAIPVTVDFERGYRLPPAELVERFAATGAVGLNLEDSDPATGQMIDAGEQADFLAAVRSAAVSLGVDLVINARTDSFLRHPGTDQVTTTIDRGTRYLAAGADCVYPIAVKDPAVISALVREIPGPINTGPTPDVRSLAALGVARISFGPSLHRHLYSKFSSTLLPAITSNKNPFEL